MKTKFTLFSAFFFLMLLASCGNGDGRTNEKISISGPTKGKWTTGKYNFQELRDSGDGEGRSLFFETDLIKISCEQNENPQQGGLGTIIIEDTTYIVVHFDELKKTATAEAASFDLAYSGPGEITIKDAGGMVLLLKTGSCCPFYLKTTGAAGAERIEIWTSISCVHKP